MPPFYLQWQSSFKPLQILLGDMRPGFGQGLVFGRSGKGRNSVSPILKNDSNSVAFRSKGENEALRGLILRYRGGRIEGAILGGLAARDARLDEQGNAISLRPGGIHVSASELAGCKRLQAWSCGLRLRYLVPHWRGGKSAGNPFPPLGRSASSRQNALGVLGAASVPGRSGFSVVCWGGEKRAGNCP